LNDHAYSPGLHDLGGGCHAWLQPGGAVGLSNAGLVVSRGESLLVDTLYDLPRTGAMLSAMAAADPAAATIDTLVMTHGNGDHCYGNRLVGDAEIVATAAAAEEMAAVPPSMMNRNLALAQLMTSLPSWISRVRVGPDGATAAQLGRFLLESFGRFEFRDVELALPTTLVSGRSIRSVGDLDVELIEVGPAHTRGDLVVHVPAAGVVFAGDIVFSGVHPLMWTGPVSRWIEACGTIEALGPRVVVPGHGPLGDLSDVAAMREYWIWLEREARARHDAGLSSMAAARDIPLDRYAGWAEPERLVASVDTLYREFDGIARVPPARTSMSRIAALREHMRSKT
jgi:cyclase